MAQVCIHLGPGQGEGMFSRTGAHGPPRRRGHHRGGQQSRGWIGKAPGFPPSPARVQQPFDRQRTRSRRQAPKDHSQRHHTLQKVHRPQPDEVVDPQFAAEHSSALGRRVQLAVAIPPLWMWNGLEVEALGFHVVLESELSVVVVVVVVVLGSVVVVVTRRYVCGVFMVRGVAWLAGA